MRLRRSVLAIPIVGICFMLLGNDGCTNNQGQHSMSGATQMTSFVKVPKNSRGLTTEQQNYEDRIRVTTDPTKIMWNHLVNMNGQFYLRMPVSGKTTSSKKRPYPAEVVNVTNAGGLKYIVSETETYNTNEVMGPDGMWGGSDEYQY